MFKPLSSKIILLVIVIDIIILCLSAILVHYYYLDSYSLPVPYQQSIFREIILFLWLSSVFKLYRPWRGESLISEFRILFLSLTSAFLLLLLIWFFLKIGADYSRIWLFFWFISTLFLMFAFRIFLRKTLRFLRQKGFNFKRILIVGVGGWTNHINKEISKTHEFGFKVVAVCEDINHVNQVLKKSKIDQIWVTMPITQGERMQQILADLGDVSVDVCWLPDTSSFRLINHSVSHVGQFPVINLSSTPITGFNAVLKNMEDKILSLFILLLISPIMVLIAIGVKLSSKGPVFYKQSRVSWNGKNFDMLKFRSMPIDSEEKTGAVWAKKGDNRSTAFGSFLRKFSLDELPQFINVLIGDMSIVGPRPERGVFVEKFKKEIPDYMRKHMVKAGITGLAQVKGYRGNTDLKKRIDYDLDYINNWSLWLDLKIIFLTVKKVFKDSNAY